MLSTHHSFWNNSPQELSEHLKTKIAYFVSTLVDCMEPESLKTQIEYAVARKFAGSSQTHAMNIAFKRIRNGKWSRPKGFADKALYEYNSHVNSWAEQKHQECSSRRVGEVFKATGH